jgi:hypothetical protein
MVELCHPVPPRTIARSPLDFQRVRVTLHAKENPMKWMALLLMCVIAVGCEDPTCGFDVLHDASDGADDVLAPDAPGADALDGQPDDVTADAADSSADALEGGEPSGCEGHPSATGGAADQESCACERARGDQECSTAGAVCVGTTTTQPAAVGCHPACDPAVPDACGAGNACIDGRCWKLCDPPRDVPCPGTDLICEQYHIGAAIYVCMPQIGFVH